jgi:hypothetical protein
MVDLPDDPAVNQQSYGPAVAVGSQGDVFFAWRREPERVFARQYLASALQPYVQLWQGDSFAFSEGVSVAVNGSGEAVVGWPHYDQALVSRFIPGLDWQSMPVDAGDGKSLYFMTVGLADSGNAVAFWRAGDDNLKVNQSVGSNWSSRPSRLDRLAGNYTQMMYRQHSQPTGAAYVAWVGQDGRKDSIFTARYLPDSGWSGSETVESSSSIASGATVASDLAGNFAVA